MTNKTSSFLAGFALLTALFSTGSYVNIIDDDDETEATSTQLHITTRGSSANDTLSYPITLYAFNAASKLQASATLNSSTDNSVLALSNGSYRLVALAGTAECTLPTSNITKAGGTRTYNLRTVRTAKAVIH
ncbi:MAG: FimB/Mfa2 family fimbrial subunit [Bacteroides intestinalis]